MKIDSKAIRELADLIEETGLNEIEVVDGEQSIRVNKGMALAAPAAVPAAGAAPAPVASPDPAAPGQASTDAPTSPESHPGAMRAPMVGTAYLQAEPGAPSFVSKGASVKEGDTIMIIEAMKVMNPIKADKTGTVTQIIVEDGQPVEYGDVLMIIE